MTPIKIIALTFIALILAKLVIIYINPMSWKLVVRKFTANPFITMFVGLITAIVILRYLLQELTIIQIFASMTFMMALMTVQFAAFGNEITELTDNFFEDRSIMKKAWLSITLWLTLITWVVYAIFI